MRILEDPDFPLVANRRTAYVFSGVLMLLSVAAFVTRGLELGIDFQGGMEFVLEDTGQLETDDVRAALGSVLASEPQVKTYGQEDGLNALLVRTRAEGDSTSAVTRRIIETLEAEFPEASPRVVGTSVVGPSFASDMAQWAVYMILGALLVVFLYILVRFEWRFGAGAVAALVHDVTITLGLFSLLAGAVPFSLQIDQSIVAAFLTIVGYSLNDTVVVFDRVREYENLFKTDEYNDVVNRSINSTLSRTFVTSMTTLLVVTILFIFGGEVLKGFSFATVVELREAVPKTEKRRRVSRRGA
ncbi:MAG: protein translocase subunit SecF [Bacteroidetes bacterium QS_9_68_14]|nr:MAG: protein translocase subunit SecF [Bacteroidetes bacterium QS_9_68_14]